MRHPLCLILIGAVVAAASLAATAADELGEKGREVFKKHQRAVVTVHVDVKISYSAPGRSTSPAELKQDLTGTVVDPSGLTIVALSSCDPSSMYETLSGGSAEASSRPKMETEVTNIRILLDDGNELPAEIVLRDKDLDLAFIRPKPKPANPLSAVDLTQSAPAQVLDQVITLNRLGQAAGRAYSASVERISAIVQKPRLFYIPDSTMTSTTLGSPAFSPDGRVVGLFVMRAIARSASSSGSSRDSLASIIVPAEEILKSAKQVPEAKPEAKEDAKGGDAAKPESKEDKK